MDPFMNKIFNDLFYDINNNFFIKPKIKIILKNNFVYINYNFNDIYKGNITNISNYEDIEKIYSICKICLRKKKYIYILYDNKYNNFIFCKHYDIIKYILYELNFYLCYDIDDDSSTSNSF